MINLSFDCPTLPLLSDEQERAIDTILAWLRSRDQEFRLGGGAGSGKTTLLQYLYDYLDMKVLVAAYMGKAVSTLRRRGIRNATTFHRLLYYASYNRRQQHWTKRNKHRIDAHDVVFVDEASMITDELRHDLLAKARKILWVRDVGQLEPIAGDMSPYLQECDFELKEIHRQAQDNPIIRFSHRLRNGQPYGFGRMEGLDILPLTAYRNVDVTACDMIACGYNATRIKTNREVRKKKGLDDTLCVGDRVVCLENVLSSGVYNGETFSVAAIGDTTHDRDGSLLFEAQLVDEASETRGSILISSQTLGGNPSRTTKADRDGILFDYAQAMTVHKLQGSEYDHVLGIDEPPGSCDPKRWRYTMATRASQRLTFLTNSALSP